ncbi:hypothetical protein [Aureispira sp. CCB-E]|uniref:hypothetical protein n=1 Tax=Aureispira sp. CCB-E TaxID=3051121 RepID=UPI0028696936|nr:hypothetical protein [Aureispira sp. CCB-E]WMX14272.1 hypothetical protein QP953_25800 [Aureispira sp. CCB-E]
MKKIIFISALLLFSVAIFAQTSPKMGAPYTDVGGKFKFYIADEDYIYTAKVKDKTELLVQKLDKTSLKELSQKIYKDALTKNAVPIKLIEVNGLIYLFYTNESKRSIVEVYVTVIDYKNLALKEEKKLLFAIEEGLYKVPYSTLCKVFVSEDKSKFLIQYQKALPKDQMSEQTFGLQVFDNELERVGGGEVLMPFRWDVMDDMQYSVQNNGDIMMAGYHKIKEEYHLVTINKDDKSLDIKATKDKNSSYFYEYAFNKNAQKYVAGFYRTGESDMNMFVINLQDSKKYEVEIPKELIPYYQGKKVNAIMALDAIGQDDGGVLVIGQELYGIEVYEKWNNGVLKSRPTSTVYNFNDYYLIRVNQDGTLRWVKRINKENKNVTNSLGEYDGPMLKVLKFHPRLQYNYIYDEENHYLFFTDNLSEYKGRMLCAYRVDDSSGEGKYTVGFNTGKIDKQKIYHIKPAKIVALGNQEFGVEAYKKKEGDFIIQMHVD